MGQERSAIASAGAVISSAVLLDEHPAILDEWNPLQVVGQWQVLPLAGRKTIYSKFAAYGGSNVGTLLKLLDAGLLQCGVRLEFLHFQSVILHSGNGCVYETASSFVSVKSIGHVGAHPFIVTFQDAHDLHPNRDHHCLRVYGKIRLIEDQRRIIPQGEYLLV